MSICGVMSERCVAATARSAWQLGYGVVLAHDSRATYPVPPNGPGEPEIPAEYAARVAEWSLGDNVIIPRGATDVRFAAPTPDRPPINRTASMRHPATKPGWRRTSGVTARICDGTDAFHFAVGLSRRAASRRRIPSAWERFAIQMVNASAMTKATTGSIWSQTNPVW